MKATLSFAPFDAVDSSLSVNKLLLFLIPSSTLTLIHSRVILDPRERWLIRLSLFKAAARTFCAWIYCVNLHKAKLIRWCRLFWSNNQPGGHRASLYFHKRECWISLLSQHCIQRDPADLTYEWRLILISVVCNYICT